MNLVDQIFDIVTNEEFTVAHRKEQIAIALIEGVTAAVSREIATSGDVIITDGGRAVAKLDSPPSLMIDAAIGQHMINERMPGGGIRFSLKNNA